MLWEAMVGARRVSGDTQLAQLQARINDAEPTIEAAWPEAPPALAAICARALMHEPAARFETAREFQGALEGYLASLPHFDGANEVARTLAAYFERERSATDRALESRVGAPESRVGASESRFSIPSLANESLRPSSSRAPIAPESVSVARALWSAEWLAAVAPTLRSPLLLAGLFVVGIAVATAFARALVHQNDEPPSKNSAPHTAPPSAAKLPVVSNSFAALGRRYGAAPLGTAALAATGAELEAGVTATTGLVRAPGRRRLRRLQASSDPVAKAASESAPPLKALRSSPVDANQRSEPGTDLRAQRSNHSVRTLDEQDPYRP